MQNLNGDRECLSLAVVVILLRLGSVVRRLHKLGEVTKVAQVVQVEVLIDRRQVTVAHQLHVVQVRVCLYRLAETRSVAIVHKKTQPQSQSGNFGMEINKIF